MDPYHEVVVYLAKKAHEAASGEGHELLDIDDFLCLSACFVALTFLCGLICRSFAIESVTSRDPLQNHHISSCGGCAMMLRCYTVLDNIAAQESLSPHQRSSSYLDPGAFNDSAITQTITCIATRDSRLHRNE